MPRKNRKISQVANRVPVKAILAITVLAVGAISYLTIQSNNDALGREIKALERRLPVLAQDIAGEQRNWTAAKAPRNMDRLMARHGIEMGWPAASQIVRLSENPDGDAPYQLHASLIR